MATEIAQTGAPPTWRNESPNDGQNANKAGWITGRIQTLLSHYFQPDAPIELREAALTDWAETLMPFSRQGIEHACANYLRGQPRRRPTPGEIRNRAEAFDQKQRKAAGPASEGDRSKLSADQRTILETEVLPTARRWLNLPDLRKHGEKTLAYWGEAI